MNSLATRVRFKTIGHVFVNIPLDQVYLIEDPNETNGFFVANLHTDLMWRVGEPTFRMIEKAAYGTAMKTA